MCVCVSFTVYRVYSVNRKIVLRYLTVFIVLWVLLMKEYYQHTQTIEDSENRPPSRTSPIPSQGYCLYFVCVPRMAVVSVLSIYIYPKTTFFYSMSEKIEIHCIFVLYHIEVRKTLSVGEEREGEKIENIKTVFPNALLQRLKFP